MKKQKHNQWRCADGFVGHQWRYQQGILFRYYNCSRCPMSVSMPRTTIGPAVAITPETLL